MLELFIHDNLHSKCAFQQTQGEIFKIRINPVTLKKLFYTPALTALFDPEHVSFNLFPETEISFRTEIKKSFLDSGFIWEGSVPGQPEVRANLSVIPMDDEQIFSVAGAFYFGGKRFVIAPSEAGYVLVHIFQQQNSFISIPPVKPQSTEPELFDSQSDQNIIEISALALYPSKIGLTLGESGIKATLGHMQQIATQVFRNSGINAAINFIASEAIAEFEHWRWPIFSMKSAAWMSEAREASRRENAGIK